MVECAVQDGAMATLRRHGVASTYSVVNEMSGDRFLPAVRALTRPPRAVLDARAG